MSRLADDWGQWASDCEHHAPARPVAAAPASVTVTYSTSRGVVCRDRVDVATGETVPVLADVLPLRRRGSTS